MPATNQHPSHCPRAATSPAQAPISLPVPYFCQRDSATAEGLRMCFSSTCAMAAEYLRPGCLAGTGQPDDRYLGIVRQFGDTTEAHAQIEALRRLGIDAELRTDGRPEQLLAQLRTDGRPEQLLAQLRMGIPIPVGWLHQGPVIEPRGGGHWSLVIGWDPAREAVWIHDPNGEALLIGCGAYSLVGAPIRGGAPPQRLTMGAVQKSQTTSVHRISINSSLFVCRCTHY